MSESTARLTHVQNRYTEGGRDMAARFGGAWLASIGFSANSVTLVGAVFSIGACVVWCVQLSWSAAYWIALPVAFVGAWFDVIDGAVAKASIDGPTVFGAQLDSICDRIVEGAMYTALAFVAWGSGRWAVAACVAALAGSFSVTYARSKAENLGLDGKGGLGGRAERLVLLGAVVLAARIFGFGYQYAAWSVFVLTIVTLPTRVLSIKRQLEAQGTP